MFDRKIRDPQEFTPHPNQGRARLRGREFKMVDVALLRSPEDADEAVSCVVRFRNAGDDVIRFGIRCE
jgi:hypothetical protein